MKRRDFIKVSYTAGLTSTSGLCPFLMDLYSMADHPNLAKKEARYYKKLTDREIECLLCPRLCRLGDKERGYCGVRENENGTYYSLVYGKACAVHVDPIEKKPLFHFLPGEKTLSMAAAGCNVNCKFCQNWEISQVRPEQITHMDFPPVEVIRSAQKYDCPVIAYTYSEPVVFYEYMIDTSIAAREKKLKTVVITGGHINPEPLHELIQVVDAIKIDLKGFSQDFYSKYVRGELQPVLDAIKLIAGSNTWLEIVYLVIPTLNDDSQTLDRMCRWIFDTAGPDVPIHFSRFHPYYLLKNLPPTPISTLEEAADIAADAGLKYVYLGNVPGHRFENTFCPICHNTVITRHRYQIKKTDLVKGKCRNCSTPIPGMWSK